MLRHAKSLLFVGFLILLIVYTLPSFTNNSVPKVSASGNPSGATVTLVPAAKGTYSQFVESPNGAIWGNQFEDNSIPGLWTGVFNGGGTIVTSPVYDGSYALRIQIAYGTNYGEYYYTTASYTTMYVRFYMQLTSVPVNTGENNEIIMIGSGKSGTNPLVRAQVAKVSGVAQWSMVWYTSSSGYTQEYGTTVSPVANRWDDVELYWTANTLHGATMKVNGTTVCTASATTYNGNSQCVSIRDYSSSSTQTGYYYIDSLVASANPIGPEARYNLVNDASDNTGLVVNGTTTQKSSEIFQTSAQTATILQVDVFVRAEANVASQGFKILVRTHSADYLSAKLTPTTSLLWYSWNETANPNTGSAWTWAEVNAIEAGAAPSTLATKDLETFTEFKIIVYYGQVTITLTSSPDTGTGFITVNGTAETTPFVFVAWIGSSESLVANNPANTVAGQSQYVYVSWSDGGAASHTYTVPSNDATVTVTFQKQYYLTVTGGSSPTGQGWYNQAANTNPTNPWAWSTVTGQSRTALTNWQLDTVNQNPVRLGIGTFTTPNIAMNAPHTANFVSGTQYYMNLTTSWTGTTITQTGSQTADNWYDSGTNSTIQATTPYTSGSSTLYFSFWTHSFGGVKQSNSTKSTLVTLMTSYAAAEAYWSTTQIPLAGNFGVAILMIIFVLCPIVAVLFLALRKH